MCAVNHVTAVGFLTVIWFASTPSANANERVNCSHPSTTRTVCRIDEPNVNERLTTYPIITFQAGDSVSVQAGGCVQTGGHGKTWKRYVNPSGPNSDRLYHGLIQIPGVQSDLVRIAGAILHPVTVPTTIDPNNAHLRLGYEDDGYGDNGYWGHDDGTENQCRNVGDAFVILTIDRSISTPPPPAPAPFDLVFTPTDPNDFPLNPQWGWQKTHPGSLPNADTQCFALQGIFSNPQCTTQSPSLDLPSGWNAIWCAEGSQHSINGHVNWMPATWQGTISWDGHSSPGTDDDYNVNLVPPANEGLTVSSEGHIHSEFDSDETIDHFRTPWWQTFHDAVDRDDASARAMIDGKFAIIVGLAGLDCEHGCATELHPVYGLAIHVNDNPSDDTWAIFVRNWGDEGYCSQEGHPLDTASMAFLIPRAAASAVKVGAASTFLTNSGGASGPAVSLVPGQGAVVAFGLPDPTQGARINGELHLQWTTAGGGAPAIVRSGPVAIVHSGGGAPAIVSTPPGEPPAPEVEERLKEMQMGLPEAARQALAARLALPKSFDGMTPQQLGAVPPRPARRALLRPATTDPRKAARDQENAKALCAAFGRNLPGAPNACAAVPQ